MIRVPASYFAIAVPGRRDVWAELVVEDLAPISIAPGEYLQDHVSISWRLNSGRIVAGVLLAEADSLTVDPRGGEYPPHVGVTIDHIGTARSVISPTIGPPPPPFTRPHTSMVPDWLGPFPWRPLSHEHDPAFIGNPAGPFSMLDPTVSGSQPGFYFRGTATEIGHRNLYAPERAGAWKGYLRVSWLGTNSFRFHVSDDGETWRQVADDLTFDLAPTHMGGFATAYRGRTDATCTYEILERTTGTI